MQLLEASQNKLLYLTREDDYKECFSSTSNGIIHLDSEMRMKNLNREAERICGVVRTSVLGQRIDIVLKKHGEDFLKIFNLSEYKKVKTTNFKLKQKDQFIYINTDSLLLLDSCGEVDGLIVILQDVTAVRVAIKQIQTTQMLMSLGELAAGVAHHVRTPLTTISGYLQIMLGRLEDDQYTVRRDILETLLDEVSYINSVVKELILFAKPPVEKEPGVEINKLLDEALLLTFKQIGGEKISIEKQLAKQLPTITADKNLIKQAVVNIMQNAIESMADEGMLSIKTWINGDLNMLVISINDTGSGVGADILARVFEPFYTTKADRMGLGLPIANRIIAEHGGFVNVTPGEISGTKVHIYLPIIDDRINRLTVVHQQILNLQ
ncbi:nitrogen regulation protein NR(II) [Pelosinus sp. sgz500959]|uniref:two-component system sensor histidine kinase NtrB n=1 Tax=Pelosinus sp. sgz500959 TaxID=3242472 RepID=UPI00366FD845